MPNPHGLTHKTLLPSETVVEETIRRMWGCTREETKYSANLLTRYCENANEKFRNSFAAQFEFEYKRTSAERYNFEYKWKNVTFMLVWQKAKNNIYPTYKLDRVCLEQLFECISLEVKVNNLMIGKVQEISQWRSKDEVRWTERVQ